VIACGRTVQFAEQLPHGNGLDTVALYTHQRIVEALSFHAALGYVETGRRVKSGHARVYLRRTTPTRQG
jgi:hypothetical protein